MFQVLNADVIQSAPLEHVPYTHAVADGVLREDLISELEASFPVVPHPADPHAPSARLLHELQVEGLFHTFAHEMISHKLRNLVAAKLDLDLSDTKAYLEFTDINMPHDHRPYSGLLTKKASMMVFMNREWPHYPDGVQRVCNSRDVNDYAKEFLPLMGRMFLYKHDEHSWQGYPFYLGRRRSLLVSWRT